MKNLISFDAFGNNRENMNEAEASTNVSTSIPSKAEVKVYFVKPGVNSPSGKENQMDYGATRLLEPSQTAKAGEASSIIGSLISIFHQNPDDLFAKVMKELRRINKKNYPACLYIVQNSPKIKAMYGKNFRQLGEFIAANYAMKGDYRGKGFMDIVTYAGWANLIGSMGGSQEFVSKIERYLTDLNPQERVSPIFTTEYAFSWAPWDRESVSSAYEPLAGEDDKIATDSRGKKIYGWNYDGKGEEIYYYTYDGETL